MFTETVNIRLTDAERQRAMLAYIFFLNIKGVASLGEQIVNQVPHLLLQLLVGLFLLAGIAVLPLVFRLLFYAKA